MHVMKTYHIWQEGGGGGLASHEKKNRHHMKNSHPATPLAGSVKLLIMSQVRLTNYVSSTTYGLFSLSMGGFVKLARQVEVVRETMGKRSDLAPS